MLKVIKKKTKKLQPLSGTEILQKSLYSYLKQRRWCLFSKKKTKGDNKRNIRAFYQTLRAWNRKKCHVEKPDRK